MSNTAFVFVAGMGWGVVLGIVCCVWFFATHMLDDGSGNDDGKKG